MRERNRFSGELSPLDDPAVWSRARQSIYRDNVHPYPYPDRVGQAMLASAIFAAGVVANRLRKAVRRG